MTITMDALFKPLNDFFINRFGSSDVDSVIFRFDKFGSKVSQDDFRLNPTDPNSPFVQAIAREKMSDLANRVPVEVGDGANVAFLADAVDEVYEQLLRSSQAFLPAGSTAQRRKALIESFSALKADAIKTLERAEMTSVSGAPLGYRLTDFSPGDWYDPGSSDAWTTHSLVVKGEDQPAAAPAVVEWRILPTDQRLQLLTRELRPTIEERVALPGTIGTHVTALRRPDVAVLRSEVSEMRTEPLGVRAIEDTPHILLKQGFTRFDVRDRLRFKEALVESAQASQVTTSEVSISFEWTIVTLKMRWLRSSFLNTGTWVIPGVTAGSWNEPGRPGSLTLLPLAFVAVRNLSIQATWTDADREALRNAMSWGPFEVVSSVDSGSVAQPGLQVVGWVLQKIPPLPPRTVGETPPTDSPDVEPRTYRVRPGDTLRKIATQFYGDPEKFLLIQRANNIPNANQIFVGQVLKIPHVEGS